VGVKVMVMNNIETDLDITNGTRGGIIDIILDPDEPPIRNGAIVELKYPPAYILVKLQRTRASHLEGLETSFIPVEPRTVRVQIQLMDRNRKKVTHTVTRRQYLSSSCHGEVAGVRRSSTEG
jgi:hypothetical protein